MQTIPPSPSQIYELELLPVTKNKSVTLKNSKDAKPQSSASQSKLNQPIKLQELYPDSFTTQALSHGPSTSDSFSNDEWKDQPVIQTMNSIGLEEYSLNDHFFKKLSNKLNQSILYPKDYAENHITGKLWVQILIDSKGRLLKIIDSSKTSPILNAYIFVNLHKVLSTPLPARYWYKNKTELAFQLNFDFSVTSVPSIPELQTVSYQKNSLFFKRRNKVKTVIERISEDYARYIPPIAPTPLGPIINFVQVYRMIQAWQGMNPIERKKRKLEMTKERIDRLLKEIEEPKVH